MREKQEPELFLAFLVSLAFSKAILRTAALSLLPWLTSLYLSSAHQKSKEQETMPALGRLWWEYYEFEASLATEKDGGGVILSSWNPKGKGDARDLSGAFLGYSAVMGSGPE